MGSLCRVAAYLNNAIHSDSESRAVLEGVEYLVNQVDAETIS